MEAGPHGLGGRPHRQNAWSFQDLMGMSVATDRLADPESADTDSSELTSSPAGGDGPTPEEIQVPVLENVDRAITGVITVVPPLLLVLAGWQMWNRELRWRDIAIFLIMYIPTGLGVTVGFHRLLTHRSFKTSPFLRGVLAVLGTMAVEGPVISWVSDHRKHHAYSDRFGDPHSPHVDHDGGWRGALRGLVHAHVGWLFDHTQRGSRERFAPDLLADPVVSFVDRTFLLWSLVGFAIPFGLGVLMGGTVGAGLEGMLWGGAVRMLVLHHVTYSINSLCHFFGRRRFATEDHSRNLLWLAPFSLGEAWHNNHHAFPTSAFHGMGRRELDISGLVIAALERAGMVWDVQRITPTRLAAKAL
jgi:stearoyl-CoA desaturase (Delta-9 desaturase)